MQEETNVDERWKFTICKSAAVTSYRLKEITKEAEHVGKRW